MAMAMASTATAFSGGLMASPVLAVEDDANDGIALMNAGDKIINKGYLDFGNGTASITIQGNEGQSMTGKRFEIFQLFNVENSADSESVNYTLNPKYEDAVKQIVAQRLGKQPAQITEYMVIDYIQTLNNNEVEGAHADQELEGTYSAFRYFVEDVRTAIKDAGIEGETVYVASTDNYNRIRLANMPYGYYIIDEISEHDENDEQYYASSLCIVNTANPTATVNLKSDYPSIIKKILEDDNKDAIGSAGDGWNDIADYEIGQTVPFRYQSTISDMNGYDGYYYAFHDSMDDELTFHNDKREISITITKGDKSYKLEDSEYNVVTDTQLLDEGDTFMIEIEDIKKIIDTEFSDTIDELGHNDYSDMTVTLTYNATLNDLAAEDTGRPGFENDVRLEFSNDADSAGEGETGYTPWDTVVCFTYKINGLKTNNYDKELAGAKFRLYSDEECKNEVFVKAKNGSADNGYVVINRDSAGGTDHTGGTAPSGAVEMVSDSNGNFTIYGLDQGIYYLKETDAPDGYRQILDPIVLTLTPSFTDQRDSYVAGNGAFDDVLIDLEATAHIKTSLDGAESETDNVLETNIDDGSADIKIVNEVGTKLPVTGSTATLIMLGAGVVLVTGAVAASVISKKKKASEE